MAYLVSVVVPTKNRYTYLKPLIKMIESFNLDELELVIQDNSDNNSEILDYLKSCSSSNISYYHSTEKLSMSQNGELSIMNAKGEYVCYIGDDDGVCRNIVDCVKWLKEQNIDAAFNNNASYLWGKVAKVRTPLNGYIEYKAEDELKKLCKNGMNLLQTKLPLIYHGIVKKSVLDKIYQKYGTLFPSVPPDISGSICLAENIGRYYELRTPVVINGASAMTGGGVLSKGGVIPLEEVSFITNDIIEQWETTIPPIWCGGYGWANSAIKTLRFIGRENLLHLFDRDYCFAKCVALRPHKSQLWKYGWVYSQSKIRFALYTLFLLLIKYPKKVNNNLPGKVISDKNVLSIIEAEKFINSKCESYQ